MLMFRKHIFSTVHPCICVLCLCHIAYVHAIQCARTQDEWNKASASLQCQEPNYYHCLKDENGNLIQQCLQRVWIQNEMCPEFNSRVRRIDVFKCQSDENNCPNTIFWSNAVYLYPICYEKTLPTTRNKTVLTTTLSSTFLTSTIPQMSGNTTSDENKNQEKVITIVISAIAAVVFIVIVIVSLVVYLVRKTHRRSNTDTVYMYANSSDLPIQLSEQRRENNEGEALIGNTTHTSASDRGGQSQQSDHKRKDKEEEKLIDGMEMKLKEIQRASKTQQSEHRRQTNKQKELIDLTMNLIKEIYGVHVLILVNGRNTDLDENLVKNAAMKELKIAVDMENSFRKWINNKTEGSYVFRDWITSDEEYDETDLRRTQLEIIHAIKENETKFVFVFPLTVWSQNTIINDMGKWNICRLKTITEHSTI